MCLASGSFSSSASVAVFSCNSLRRSLELFSLLQKSSQGRRRCGHPVLSLRKAKLNDNDYDADTSLSAACAPPSAPFLHSLQTSPTRCLQQLLVVIVLVVAWEQLLVAYQPFS